MDLDQAGTASFAHFRHIAVLDSAKTRSLGVLHFASEHSFVVAGRLLGSCREAPVNLWSAYMRQEEYRDK
jgi:hypothetical protein